MKFTLSDDYDIFYKGKHGFELYDFLFNETKGLWDVETLTVDGGVEEDTKTISSKSNKDITYYYVDAMIIFSFNKILQTLNSFTNDLKEIDIPTFTEDLSDYIQLLFEENEEEMNKNGVLETVFKKKNIEIILNELVFENITSQVIYDGENISINVDAFAHHS